MNETENIRKYFTERRKRCLSINRIEREAGLPPKTLWFAVHEAREMPAHHLPRLLPVLQEFGYVPL